MAQYIYKLKLKTAYFDEQNWTDKEEAIITRHFNGLKKLTEEGTVVLAGRTLNDDETQFGIVIFEAESEEEAQNIMLQDPAIAEGLMDGTLFPYRIALMRK